MDRNSIQLATAIIHAASLFGFITNIISIITISISVKMHTAFGILCAFLAANNCVVLVLNSVWYLLPDSGIFKSGSVVSRIFGMIGCFFWQEGIRFHILISLNRFFAIVYPSQFKKFTTTRNTTIAAIVALLIAVLQCSPLILVEDIWFCYDREHVQWAFSLTQAAQFYSIYFYYLDVAAELGLIMFLDVLTIINLRLAYSKKTADHIIATSYGARALEIRLFKQAFSQTVPFWSTLILFDYVTPHLTDDFAKFLTTTLVWHLAHGLDGLIFDLFHTRFHLFRTRKKKNMPSSVAPSTSFPLSSIA